MKIHLFYILLFVGIMGTSAQVKTPTNLKEKIADVPFAIIEKSPVFPGCTGNTNIELKKCTSNSIEGFVKKQFNVGLFKDLELNVRRMRISVQFKINKEGKAVDMRARAPHPDLEKEAIRVISALPVMEPGRQRNNLVRTLYALPIIYEFDSKGNIKPNAKRRKS